MTTQDTHSQSNDGPGQNTSKRPRRAPLSDQWTEVNKTRGGFQLTSIDLMDFDTTLIESR